MVTLAPGDFLFVRHGETDANADDIICGQTDVPLNEAGLAQARAAAAWLVPGIVARIVASPLARARQTAEAAALRCGLAVSLVPGLAERNWGEWEGRPRSVLRRDETPPGGESPAAFRDRIRAAFAALDLSVPTLIVAHSGTDREIHALLTDAPHRRLENAQIVRWSRGPRGWNCHECFKPGG